MNPPQNPTLPQPQDASSIYTPLLLGCALGVLLGGGMSRPTRRAVALTLVSVGVAMKLPKATAIALDQWTGPESAVGSRHTLRSIRDAGTPPETDFYE